MPKILAIAGSIRRDSWNRKLIRVAVEATRAAGGDVTLTWPTIRCRSTTATRGPRRPADREARVQQFDSATAEEHPRVGVARWQGESGLVPYQNKVAALLAASPGTFGGMRMLPHLRQVLNTLGACPARPVLAGPDTAFDVAGGTLMLKSPARLHALVLELVSTTAALKRA
jgi:NAD(P)H-dependent FMN reductase